MGQGFGAFGKMPAVGDFFRIDPPAGFVTVWDDWLQRGMLEAQDALGEAWDENYMSAPIWRFTLAAGLAGPAKVIGVLMPSVDRVGRRFPLTLVAAIETEGPATLDHFSETALFVVLEDLALDMLEDGASRDTLAERLAEIPAPEARSVAPLRELGKALVLTQARPDGCVGELAAGLLAGRYDRPSVWSSDVNGVPRLMVCDGLPEGPQSLGIFDLHAPIWTEARPL